MENATEAYFVKYNNNIVQQEHIKDTIKPVYPKATSKLKLVLSLFDFS